MVKLSSCSPKDKLAKGEWSISKVAIEIMTDNYIFGSLLDISSLTASCDTQSINDSSIATSLSERCLVMAFSCACLSLTSFGAVDQ
ncbi:hypothetical protein VCHA53O466_320047 [Vibrio chagasii]|nr:hypothetical protein VCHA53O466_320047 [Vibrio chagasii]